MKPTKPVLEKTTAEFIEKLVAADGPPLYELSPADARKVLEKVQDVAVKKLPAVIEDIIIPGQKQELSVRIVRPEGAREKLPIIVYFHGGGWILGSKETHDRLIRDIAHGANAAIIFVNFTLSPEGKSDLILDQAYAATQFFGEQGDSYNLDTSRLAIAGDSVGGNMATVVALLAKERSGPKIGFQMLFYPVTDASMSSESYTEFAEGPWLTKAAMAWFWDAYEPDMAKRKLYTRSPLNATLEQLQGLPPTLLITDENDVLRDEGEAYAHKLLQACVEVTGVRFLGTHHDFMLLNALAQTPATKGAIALASEYAKSIFYAK